MKRKNIHVKDLHGTVANHNFLPSKQKLELSLSKTRLLLSRSGVLIEFKSRVFTGYSHAIKDENSTFHQVGGRNMEAHLKLQLQSL